MTPVTATPSVWTNWTWPEEVTAFAVEHQADAYLEPLREALARLFPTATEAKAVHSLYDEPHVVFEVAVQSDELGDYITAVHAWHDELFRIVPSPKVWAFRLFLIPV